MSPFPHSSEIHFDFSHLPSLRQHWLRLLLVPCLIFALACSGSIESQMAEIRSLQQAGQFDPSIAPLRRVLADEPKKSTGIGISVRKLLRALYTNELQVREIQQLTR